MEAKEFQNLLKYSKIYDAEKIMSITEIENELEKMSNSERRVVVEIATKLIHGKTSGKCRLSFEEKRAKLGKSVEIMLSE